MEIVKEFGKWCTGNIADALEGMGYMVAMCQDIRPLFVPINMSGRAVTVKFERTNRPGDLKDIALEVKEMAKPGDVIMYACDGYRHGDTASWGENSSTAIQVRGAMGAVIDGGCRDTRRIRDAKFPTFVRAITPGGMTSMKYPVAYNVPVVCGGIRVHPGDIVVGDDDGIVVIPREIEDKALKYVKAYGERDQAVAPALRDGKSVEEAYGIKKDWIKKAGLM